MASSSKRAALLAVVTLVGLLAPLAPLPAARAAIRTPEQAPIVADDAVTITTWPGPTDLHVLANDSDPDGGNLQICRVEAPDDAGLGVHIWSDNGEPGSGATPSGSTYLILEPTQGLRPGTLTVTYYACDRQLLTAATLTVTVVKITAAPVPGQPGVVRFTNPLDEPIDILYGAPHGEGADGGFFLKAHASKDRTVTRPSIRWVAFPDGDGDDDDPAPIGGGIVRETGAPPGAGPASRVTHSQQRLWATGVSRPAAVSSAPGARQDRVGPGPDRATSGQATEDPATEDPAPVTEPDHVTVDYYDEVDAHVLANDSDDTPADLAVCWVDVPRSSGLEAGIEPWWAESDRARSDSPDRYIQLDALAASPGTYHLTYYACDKQRLTPGTLTVTVRRFPPVKVRRVPGHPGTLDFVNGGYRRVEIHYFPSDHYSEKYHFSIKPHADHRLHVAYDDLSFFADSTIGPLNDGRIKHVYPRHHH